VNDDVFGMELLSVSVDRDNWTLYILGGPTKVKPTYIFVCKI